MPQAPNQFNVEWVYVEEVSWGTTPGTPETKRLPVINGDIGLERPLGTPGYMHDDRSRGKAFPGKYTAGGRLLLSLQLENIGTILKHVLGGTVQTTGTGPYTHVIPGGALPPGLTIEKWLSDFGGTNKSWRYPGSRINRLRLQFAKDALRAELDVLAKTEAASATRLDSTPTLVLSTDLDSFTATIKRGGTAVSGLIEGEVVVENEIAGDEFTLADQGRYSLNPGARKVSGKIRGFFEDETHYNAFLAGTGAIHEFSIVSGTSSLKIEVLSALLHGKPISEATRERGGSLVQDYNYEGNPDVNFNNVKATLINNQSTI